MNKYLFSAVALLALSACSTSDVKSSLGLRKSAPDEFAVISNPPLSVPPSFDMVTPTDEPRVFSENEVSHETKLGKDDSEFLGEFDKPDVKTKIQKQIDDENKQFRKSHSEKGAVRRALNNINGQNEEKVIDPVSERRRIRDNVANDLPINEGEVSNKSKSTLERIFGN